MIHPVFGRLTYRVNVYATVSRSDRPFTRDFDHWQGAYAYAKSIIREDCGVRAIDVIKHRHDGFIFQGILRWDRAHGRTA